VGIPRRQHCDDDCDVIPASCVSAIRRVGFARLSAHQNINIFLSQTYDDARKTRPTGADKIRPFVWEPSESRPDPNPITAGPGKETFCHLSTSIGPVKLHVVRSIYDRRTVSNISLKYRGIQLPSVRNTITVVVHCGYNRNVIITATAVVI